MLLRSFLLAVAVATCAPAVHAEFGPMPMSLKNVPLPPVPGLYDGPAPLIVDRQAAVALGKALFWDSNVGSDGMACASCHFQAGADRRVRNQLAPGGKHGIGTSFDTGADGLRRGPNLALRAADFPLIESLRPLTETDIAGLARWSDDVVGSAGSVGGRFKAVSYAMTSDDTCDRQPGATYHVGGIGTRSVVARNAPTVINAVFNHRLLWDGRANNVFNGSSAGGPRDPAAGIWVVQPDGSVRRERLALVNSALASQALTAPIDSTEMSCSGRSLPDLGRKLLYRTALETQPVHPTDSVLGPLSMSARAGALQPGLDTDYITLVQRAFHPRLWSSTARGAYGKPATGAKGVMSQAYSLPEANFGLFFGLALQAYQSTLVSDDSPFDRSARDAAGLPVELTAQQLRGLQRFRTAHCALCHIGPNFTSAAVDTNASLVASHPLAFGDRAFKNGTSRNVVTRLAGIKGFGFVDTGFAATGVGRDEWDRGLAGQDEFGHDLALAAQYVGLLAGRPAAVVDPRVAEVRACDLPHAVALNRATAHEVIFTQRQGVQPQAGSAQGCLNPSYAFVPTAAAASAELALAAGNKRLQLLTEGAFKIPTLRNVELTGPYMHNGSMATLEQVIEFYTRGGNFTGPAKQFGTVFAQPDLQLDAAARAELLSFLQSLTDERVRYERAPFDHPELRVPHGHAGDRTRVQAAGAYGPAVARDEFMLIPAVGAAGRATPLQPFHTHLMP